MTEIKGITIIYSGANISMENCRVIGRNPYGDAFILGLSINPKRQLLHNGRKP